MSWVKKNKKELMVFHRLDFYKSITCMMMSDHWNYRYFISLQMHIDFKKYVSEQKNDFNAIHMTILNLKWHFKSGLNPSQNRRSVHHLKLHLKTKIKPWTIFLIKWNVFEALTCFGMLISDEDKRSLTSRYDFSLFTCYSTWT